MDSVPFPLFLFFVFFCCWFDLGSAVWIDGDKLTRDLCYQFKVKSHGSV